MYRRWRLGIGFVPYLGCCPMFFGFVPYFCFRPIFCFRRLFGLSPYVFRLMAFVSCFRLVVERQVWYD